MKVLERLAQQDIMRRATYALDDERRSEKDHQRAVQVLPHFEVL
jgi:hypothetical protein